jgi:hypothetical protein
MKPVPFKLWMAEKCRETGLKYSCLFNRMARGTMPRPPKYVDGQRSQYVLVEDAVADRLFPAGIKPSKPRIYVRKEKAVPRPPRGKCRLPIIRFCDCGARAERRHCGAWACERCIAWEKQSIFAEKRPAWAKYAEPARIHFQLG